MLQSHPCQCSLSIIVSRVSSILSPACFRRLQQVVEFSIYSASPNKLQSLSLSPFCTLYFKPYMGTILYKVIQGPIGRGYIHMYVQPTNGRARDKRRSAERQKSTDGAMQKCLHSVPHSILSRANRNDPRYVCELDGTNESGSHLK